MQCSELVEHLRKTADEIEKGKIKPKSYRILNPKLIPDTNRFHTMIDWITE